MNCSVALQFLPMDAASDDEVCRIVDEVIAEIDASGLSYYVGPFETAVEGDLDECMDLVKRCIKAGEKAGCAESASYLKISYRSDRDVMSTGRKIAKYHTGDPRFPTIAEHFSECPPSGSVPHRRSAALLARPCNHLGGCVVCGCAKIEGYVVSYVRNLLQTLPYGCTWILHTLPTGCT